MEVPCAQYRPGHRAGARNVFAIPFGGHPARSKAEMRDLLVRRAFEEDERECRDIENNPLPLAGTGRWIGSRIRCGMTPHKTARKERMRAGIHKNRDKFASDFLNFASDFGGV